MGGQAAWALLPGTDAAWKLAGRDPPAQKSEGQTLKAFFKGILKNFEICVTFLTKNSRELIRGVLSLIKAFC